ncbi:hypothetical protein VTI74DRAFT_1782 [Chaetomium olivicolor]
MLVGEWLMIVRLPSFCPWTCRSSCPVGQGRRNKTRNCRKTKLFQQQSSRKLRLYRQIFSVTTSMGMSTSPSEPPYPIPISPNRTLRQFRTPTRHSLRSASYDITPTLHETGQRRVNRSGTLMYSGRLGLILPRMQSTALAHRAGFLRARTFAGQGRFGYP